MRRTGIPIVERRARRVLATLDPRLQPVNDFDVDAVVEFLHALRARDARNLSDIVPDSVPSGLPLF